MGTISDQIKNRSNLLGSQNVIVGCVILLLALAAFLGGTGIGFGLGRLSARDLAAGPSVTAGRTPQAAQATGEPLPTPIRPQPTVDDFALFHEAMRLLYKDFYGELPSIEEANYEAIQGVLRRVDDPNTSFLTPEQAKAFLASIQGVYEGIGARVAWDDENKALRIAEPFENQPAWIAGIRRNDLVIAIDGEDISELDQSQAVSRILGPQGTSVTLTIRRAGRPESFDVVVVRDRIEMPVIHTDILGADEDIGYVRLTQFSNNSGRLVRQAVEDLLDSGPRALIFDLRGNGGGLLTEAINVASVFLQEQPVLIERYADGSEEIYRSRGSAAVGSLPLVLLVDSGSASASEIVAGAVQDAGRAVLIGSATFGKGSVQLPHQLEGGSIMRVTIARWYTPKDRSIDRTGLDPDIAVDLSDEEIEAGLDPQLERAVEFLETGQ